MLCHLLWQQLPWVGGGVSVGRGQGEASGAGHLRFTSPRGLSLGVNKERPGGSRAGGSAGIVDGSPRAPQQSLMLALLCRGPAPGQAAQ